MKDEKEFEETLDEDLMYNDTEMEELKKTIAVLIAGSYEPRREFSKEGVNSGFFFALYTEFSFFFSFLISIFEL